MINYKLEAAIDDNRLDGFNSITSVRRTPDRPIIRQSPGISSRLLNRTSSINWCHADRGSLRREFHRNQPNRLSAERTAPDLTIIFTCQLPRHQISDTTNICNVGILPVIDTWNVRHNNRITAGKMQLYLKKKYWNYGNKTRILRRLYLKEIKMKYIWKDI